MLLSETIQRHLDDKIMGPIPADILPMSFKLREQPFNDEAWQFEIKWDGFRMLSYNNGKNVELRSRNNNSFTKQFSVITEELRRLNLNAVLDGEVVVLDESGCSDFNSLMEGNYTCLVYYVFDIIWYDGYDLTNIPLYQRRDLLDSILPSSEIVRYSQHVDGKGIELFELCKQRKVEGIVAKNKYSHYYPGIRTSNWLKIKCTKTAEAVVAGLLLDKDKAGSGFSSLIIGLENNNSYRYAGIVDTGLTESQLKHILSNCKATRDCIFEPVPKVNSRSHFREKIKNAEIIWLKPTLKCHVNYLDMDCFGLMRHASFKGLNEVEITR